MSDIVDISADQTEAVAKLTAYLLVTIENLLKTQPFVTIGLSGGSLIKLLTTELLHSKERLTPLSDKLKFILCDERFVPFSSPDSTYAEYLKANLFSGLNVPNENVYPINEKAANVEECASEYAKRIQPLLNKNAGFDILLLGMGPDGHTCSLFPGHPLFTNAAQQTEIVLPISDSPKPPPERVTLTLNYVNNSSHLLFWACGAGKAEMIRRILGDKDLSLPCANVRPNSDTGVLKWFIDNDAAKLLR